MSRTKVNLIELKPGTRFYVGPRSRIPYRKLPDSNIMENDMWQRYEATIHHWVREDWTKFYTHHSWSGNAPDVWVG